MNVPTMEDVRGEIATLITMAQQYAVHDAERIREGGLAAPPDDLLTEKARMQGESAALLESMFARLLDDARKDAA